MHVSSHNTCIHMSYYAYVCPMIRSCKVAVFTHVPSCMHSCTQIPHREGIIYILNGLNDWLTISWRLSERRLLNSSNRLLVFIRLMRPRSDNNRHLVDDGVGFVEHSCLCVREFRGFWFHGIVTSSITDNN